MTATNLLKAVVEEKTVKLKLLEAQLEELAKTCLKKRKEQNELKDRIDKIDSDILYYDQHIDFISTIKIPLTNIVRLLNCLKILYINYVHMISRD